jgi:hypothetical protein
MKQKQTDPQADQPISASEVPMPSLDRIQQELATATSLDDFFGKQGILARLFASTLEQMLEAELTAHLGYDRYAPEGAIWLRPRGRGTAAGEALDQQRAVGVDAHFQEDPPQIGIIGLVPFEGVGTATALRPLIARNQRGRQFRHGHAQRLVHLGLGADRTYVCCIAADELPGRDNEPGSFEEENRTQREP